MRADSINPSAHREVGAFPAIYDDELLYSIVARFGRLAGYTDADQVNLDLFDRAFNYAASAIPSNMDELARHVPASLGLTSRDLVSRHTMLPYFSAFLTKEAEEKTVGKARIDRYDVGPIRTVERPLSRPVNLRFCPECHRVMRENGQELHWKRVHQLAIVAVCPEHGCDLRETSISPGVGDRALQPVTDELCANEQPSVIPASSTVDREALLELAHRARALMQGEYPEGMARDSGRQYAQLFRDLGYFRKDRLDWSKLLPDAQAAIGGIVQALPGLTTISRDGMGWFAHAMSSNRPDHTDSVLITDFIARRIKARAPRFWATLDRATGEPLLPLSSAA